MSSPKGGTRLGTRFGPYELKSLIGVGGMGEVYRAYDTAKERTVAIKLLRPDMAADPNFQERFRRESRVAARLQEPHVIPVHDFGDIDGVLYIDMRLVEGASLKELLRTDGPLPPTRAVSIITQVAAALDAAHSNGLVHRDIKPENVLLNHDDFAYLVDFGIAHGGGEATVTKTGLVIGSCAYMAPERISGERGGPASDIYSLTCLLYECLTGRAPYDSGDLREVMGAQLFSPPPRPSIMRRGISRAFDEVIARGMAKRPSDRFATAGELAKAAAAATEHVAAPPMAPPSAPSTRQFSAVDPNPARTGYQPAYAPLPPPPANRKPRFGPAQVGLVVTTIVLFTAAVVLALVLAFGNNGGDSAPQPPLALPPSTTTETTAPSASETTTTTTAPTTTSPTTTTSGPPIAGVSGTDAQGFVGHTARCTDGSTPAAAIRTAQSLAVICEMSPGNYQYRGERLRDGANVQLNNARPLGNGFVATNPADGARYDVQPGMLTISSNGSVDSAEPALEYGSADR